jgi:hypothetical protein
VSWRVVFDNRSSQPSAFSPNQVRDCDPLPTGQPKRKNKAEIGPDWTAEKHKKRLRPLGRIALWAIIYLTDRAISAILFS